MASDQGQAIVPVEQTMVVFYGREIIAVRLPDGRIAAAFRAMCEALQLDRSSQLRRVREDEAIADQLVLVSVETGGGVQALEMLTAWAIPTWLTGIRLGMLSAEKRAAILAFKREAADVLYRHFARASVALPQPTGMEVTLVPPVDAQQIGVLVEQIAELSGVVGFLREHLQVLLALPDQVGALALRLDQALALLGALSARQQDTETQLATTGEQLAEVDQRTKGLTPAHKRAIIDTVQEMVRLTRQAPTPLTYPMIYGRLNRRYHAASYGEIPDEQFEDALAFLHEMLRRATGGQAPEQGRLF